MKFLILIVVVLLVLWVMRGKRPQVPSARPPEPPPVPQEPMLACAQCGLHLPRAEALPGRGGVFCSESHRTMYEQAHPPA
ncbi:MAG: hypothetical protein JF606_02095 [Burkholderiales bacterium]|jgi:uncharacterized protein|nr:hypothetical protein [Burkholderiales bacterium]